ncbi:MAG: alkaline phosphatase D family protein [Akkermansiaceae bacterium]
MKKQLTTITLYLTLCLSFVSAKEPAQDTSPLTKLACGSCFKPNYKSAPNIWPVIADTKPQAFLFMGDCIYADTHDMDVMRQKYQALTELPAYAKFSKQHKIIPIWDDHDYGVNDAGEEYPEKAQSQKIFLDTYGFPEDHPARSRKGIYHTYTQGPEGKVTQIINLDTRYHRSALDRRKVGRRQEYFPVTDPKATMLGDAQWAWLEAELKKPADLRIIVSSIQIISSEHRFEKWSNIPAERQRFLDLLKKSNVKRVVILSGDRHLAEISKLTPADTNLNFDLIELTSSGLTHASAPKGPNKYQVPGSFANVINFGTLDIDWSNKIPKVSLAILDRDGKQIFKVDTNFKE